MHIVIIVAKFSTVERNMVLVFIFNTSKMGDILSFWQLRDLLSRTDPVVYLSLRLWGKSWEKASSYFTDDCKCVCTV